MSETRQDSYARIRWAWWGNRIVPCSLRDCMTAATYIFESKSARMRAPGFYPCCTEHAQWWAELAGINFEEADHA